MRKLLAANLLRLRKIPLFWGTLLFHVAFGLFRIYTLYADGQRGYQASLDDAALTCILVEGLVLAVFTGAFLGTEYSDGTVRNKIAAGHTRSVIYLAGLLTNNIACLLFSAVYLLTVLLVGIPVLGGPTHHVAAPLLGTLVTAAAFCSIYTLIGMVISHKSTSCILCILLFFCLQIGATYVGAKLNASPERMVVDMVDGEMVSHMEPNPQYPTDGQRAVYQFVFDFLPTGQAVQYMLMTARLQVLVSYSGVIILAAAGAGLIHFRRKDIR